MVVWGELGEVVSEYLHKGSLVHLTGPIRTRKFTDKEGAERVASEVVANEVMFLDRAEKQAPEDEAPAPGAEEAPF